jgi:proteic killer suppression protein
MKFELVYTHSYVKRAAKFIKKHPELRSQYEKTLELLELNPFHPALRIHKLKGNLSVLYSVSINIGYRIAIDLIVEKQRIIPVDVGSHDQVYG